MKEKPTQAESSGKRSDPKSNEFFIVGIGASAGGLEALERFFQNMPPTSGMAFVVVQHLSPDYKSLMVELLSKYTPMEIFRVEDGMSVEPNCVYLIPPKKTMTIYHNQLFLQDIDYSHGLNLPIDIFFRSLAEDKGEKGIGIILSGTGSDGTLGLREIKGAGGMVIAQEQASAKFDGMPRSAVSTGLVDYILTPEEMPNQLLSYIKHPYVISDKKDSELELKGKDSFAKILSLIRNQTGVDFNYYKPNTIIRRIERRISISQIDRIDHYITYLYQNPSEIKTLYKELLIGVTKFFRDTKAFEIITEKVIPFIIANKKVNETIRVWVAGCSTGEEAYTLAILFKEALNSVNKNQDVKIFATDLDKAAIEQASMGVFTESITADIEPEMVNRYFIKKNDRYQVTEEIRRMVIFSTHNIIKDPPFSKIDLISCRNLLIYLNSTIQKKILSLFHFSLNLDGFLFLGSSETVGELTDLFTTFDSKWKIFQYKGGNKLPVLNNFSMSNEIRGQSLERMREYNLPPGYRSLNLTYEVYESILTQFIPPTLVLDENHNLIHVFNEANKYLNIPQGNVTFNVLKMVDQGLSIALSTALRKSVKENRRIHYSNIRLDMNRQKKILNLSVNPISIKRTKQRYFVVSLQETDDTQYTQKEETFEIDDKINERIQDLERELQSKEEDLQATIEELETSNEELQAANEELLASNEELQSTNEELQSVNEELYTVNSEYQNKIEELTELNNDLNNLLNSNNIGTIFLDRDLRIRKFTPAIKKEFNLLDIDIGRPISHISNNLLYERLVDDVKETLETLGRVERELENKNGRWFLMRVLPYQTTENVIKGVVVTFLDITEMKKANREIQKLTFAVEYAPSSILITDPDQRIIYVNKRFQDITGYRIEELRGKKPDILRTDKTDPAVYEEMKNAWRRGEIWSGELCNRMKDGSEYWVYASISAQTNSKGEITSYIKVSEDITQKKRYEDNLLQSRQFLQSTLDSLPWGILIIDMSGTILTSNQRWNTLVDNVEPDSQLFMEGKNYLDECEARTVDTVFLSVDIGTRLREMIRSEKNSFALERKWEKDGETLWFLLSCTRYKTSDSERIMLHVEDITLRKQQEQQRIRDHKLLMNVINTIEDCILVTDSNGKILFINDNGMKHLQEKREKITGFHYSELSCDWLDENKKEISHDHHPMTKALDSGEAVMGKSVYLRNAAKRLHHLNLNIIPMFGDNNTMEYLVLWARTIGKTEEEGKE